MNRKRLGLCGLLSVTFLLVAVEPALAQSSINEKLIRGLNRKLLYVAIPITILVEGILFYTVWKFKDNDDPQPTRENRRLEITWTLATAVILLFVGLGAYMVLINPAISLVPDAAQGQQPQAQQEIQPAVTMNKSGAVAPPSDSNVTEVEAVSQQWSWTFNYPEANVSSSGTMVLPANTTIYMHTTSTDVIHAIHIPALGLKQDSFPGQYNTIKTNITDTGTYQLYCAEYCGSGHSNMLANVTVVSQNQYQSWLNSQQSSGSASSGNSSSGNSSAMAPLSVKPA
jgi:cytochrome c oxidase subunit 2